MVVVVADKKVPTASIKVWQQERAETSVKDCSLLPIHMYSSGFRNVFRHWLRKLHLEQVAPKFLTHIHTHNLSMPILFAFKLACMKIDLASSRTFFVTPSSLTFSSENT